MIQLAILFVPYFKNICKYLQYCKCFAIWKSAYLLFKKKKYLTKAFSLATEQLVCNNFWL